MLPLLPLLQAVKTAARIVRALDNHKAPVAVGEISAETGLSVSHIEQIISFLRQNGLVVGIKGPGGGYHLQRDCSLWDVVIAMEPKLTHSRKAASEDIADLGVAFETWAKTVIIAKTVDTEALAA